MGESTIHCLGFRVHGSGLSLVVLFSVGVIAEYMACVLREGFMLRGVEMVSSRTPSLDTKP